MFWFSNYYGCVPKVSLWFWHMSLFLMRTNFNIFLVFHMSFSFDKEKIKEQQASIFDYFNI